jgi:hypothetical protein
MTRWRLKRTMQCDKCPWRVATNPHDIPNGYTEERHRALERTISKDPLDFLSNGPLYVMACHETENTHCIGWLVNQIGPGNNVALRIHMLQCENAQFIKLRGEQHQRFEDTLP